MSDILNYLDSKGIEYKPADESNAIIRCSQCGKKKLYINTESGVFHCFVCEAERPDAPLTKGHISKLKEEWGDSVRITKSVIQKKDPDFTDLVEEHHKALMADKKILKLLLNRGIEPEDAERFKLGFVRKWNQNWLSIPSYEDGIPKLLKYRKLPPDENKEVKKYMREEGSKSILFNQDVLKDSDICTINEGEIDAIALIKHGYKNVVGLTGGAGTFKSEWYDLLNTKSKIYLILDSDEVGQTAAREVWAARLGENRCFNVLLPTGEDVNSFFLKHTKEEFDELLSKAHKFTINNVVSLSDSLKTMYALSKTDAYDTYPLPWEKFNRAIGGGLMRKRLYTISGRQGHGKCVKFDTEITDPNTGAIYTIEDIVQNKKISTIFSKNLEDKVTISSIAEYVDSGIQDCFRVDTDLGKYIECPSHNKLLTVDGWKEISNISIGDLIAIPRKLSVFGEIHVNKNIARLLGYMISEGGTTTSTPTFTSSDSDSVSEMREICDYFDCVLQNSESNKLQYRIVKKEDRHSNKSSTIVKILEKYEIRYKYSHEKYLSKEIFRWDKESLQHLISTMWSGDGSVSINKTKKGDTNINCSYFTSSKKLAYQLQHLLLRFDILSSFRPRPSILRESYVISVYTSEIKKLHSNFRLCSPKQNNLDIIVTKLKTLKTRSASISPKLWPIVIKEIHKYKINQSKMFGKHKEDYRGPIQERFLWKLFFNTGSEIILNMLLSDIGFVKVKSIKNIGKHKTYDISVPNTECFIANDIIVHNTSMALQIGYHLTTKYNLPVLVWCMELPATALATKIIQMHYQMDYAEVDPSNALAYDIVKEFPIYFGYKSRITPDVFYNTMKECRNRYGIQLGVFDNFQHLVRGKNSLALEEDASKMFKELTMDLNIMFLLISQPRKNPESSGSLVQEDLRGSSAQIDDADVIITLNRKREKGEEGNRSLSPVTDVNVDKGRFSSGGRFKLYFDGGMSTFRDFEE